MRLAAESPFLLRQLMLRLTMDTLLGDHVSVPVSPPDPANIGMFARRAPARNTGITAPTFYAGRGRKRELEHDLPISTVAAATLRR